MGVASFNRDVKACHSPNSLSCNHDSPLCHYEKGPHQRHCHVHHRSGLDEPVPSGVGEHRLKLKMIAFSRFSREVRATAASSILSRVTVPHRASSSNIGSSQKGMNAHAPQSRGGARDGTVTNPRGERLARAIPSGGSVACAVRK